MKIKYLLIFPLILFILLIPAPITAPSVNAVNEGILSISFNITSSPPVIIAISPADGYQFSSSTDEISYTVTTDQNASCYYSEYSFDNVSKMIQMSSTGFLSHTQTITGLGEGTITRNFKCNDTDSSGPQVGRSVIIKSGGSVGIGGTGLPDVIFNITEDEDANITIDTDQPLSITGIKDKIDDIDIKNIFEELDKRLVWILSLIVALVLTYKILSMRKREE